MNLKSILKGLAFAMVGLHLFAVPAGAIPADPTPREWIQPDGTVVTVRQWGDEAAHGYVTLDGYLLACNEQGWMCYGEWNGQEVISTTILAHDVEQRVVSETLYLNGRQKAQLGMLYNAGRTLNGLKGPARAGGQTAYPTKGKRKTVAILVDFPGTTDSGVTFTVPNPHDTFHDMLNKVGFDHGKAVGSVHDYFLNSSNGQFDLTFDVYGPVTLSKDISFYGKNLPGGDLNAWNMAVEACQILDDEVDFTQYDLDLDGVIDNVYIFYAGEGEATGGAPYTVWPHAADIERLSGEQFLFDGVRLNHYACSNELFVQSKNGQTTSSLEGIGTVCHEFTHVLGFPDLYDTKENGSFTPGAWSIMDNGSHNNDRHTPPTYSSYERYCMGWIQPRVLNEPTLIILDNINKNQACMIRTDNEDEFFLLENRQQSGWDEFIPGHGMLIWHIEYQKDMWDANQVNIFPYNQLVDIEEADHICSDGTRNGDCFPGAAGVTSFTDDTTPGARTNAGDPTGVAINDIKEQGGLISFKVNGGKPVVDGVTALDPMEVTPISFVARWEASALENVTYLLNVYEQMGNSRVSVEDYTNRPVKETLCLVKGLKAETTYYYDVKVQAADGSESEPSKSVTVKTGVMTFEYSSPEIMQATKVGDTSFQANWKKMDSAEKYDLSVYQQEKGIPDTLTVDFTGGIKSMPYGWRTDCKMTVSMKGYYGESAPSLSMTDDYAYIESPVLDKPVRGLSFWYRLRNKPTADNFIVVSGLVGKDWQELVTYPLTLDGNSQGRIAAWSDTESDNIFPKDCKAIRITYRLMGQGALAIDDVKLAYDDKPYPVYLPEWKDRSVGNVVSFVVDGLTPDTEYFYCVRGADSRVNTQYSAPCMVKTLEDGNSIETESVGEPMYVVVEGYRVTVKCVAVADGVSARLYDVRGALLAQTEVMAGEVVFVVPAAGTYLMKADKRTLKFVVGN